MNICNSRGKQTTTRRYRDNTKRHITTTKTWKNHKDMLNYNRYKLNKDALIILTKKKRTHKYFTDTGHKQLQRGSEWLTPTTNPYLCVFQFKGFASLKALLDVYMSVHEVYMPLWHTQFKPVYRSFQAQLSVNTPQVTDGRWWTDHIRTF